MAIDEASDTERALNRLKKTGRFLSTGFRIIFVVYCIIWIALAGLFFLVAFFPDVVPGSGSGGLQPFILCVLFGLLIAGLLRIAVLIFDDVSKGESPFSIRQVKRIRLAAILFLAYVVLEMIFPSGQSSLVQQGDFQVNYWVADRSEHTSIQINFGMLGAAIIFYCLSLVFEYGTLLQQLSDETL